MIACVWDYYGTDSFGTAEHFEKHLKEFIQIRNVLNCTTGVQKNGTTQSFVWCVGNKDSLNLVITYLKPKHFIPKENFIEFGIKV
ncbi:hypothetical protein [Fluviispira multicolorata]|uniref:Uncharacterized protein n=1 Tax=Fluviispira multicolorata TaxID=2654512 RepID=A0A833JD68_9BACT|nr:hypothetical protein [Fluviispira multicolorata]KAB8031078.1 hypothetical protein GCL57_08920 [Fluviispira multicolorata]